MFRVLVLSQFSIFMGFRYHFNYNLISSLFLPHSEKEEKGEGQVRISNVKLCMNNFIHKVNLYNFCIFLLLEFQCTKIWHGKNITLYCISCVGVLWCSTINILTIKFKNKMYSNSYSKIHKQTSLKSNACHLCK